MFRQYQHQGSTSSRSTIRTISGVSQISEETKSVNGSPAEEMAPSTVVELAVDEGSQKSLRSASGSTITSMPVEAAEDRNQPSVTVSNILARAEEEQNVELSSADQSNVDKETSTAVHKDEVTEPASEKSSHDAETSGNAQSDASFPTREDDSAAPTKDDVQTEVAHLEQGDSSKLSTEESSVASEKGVESKQMSSEPPAPLENSVVGGASIFNEDLVDVSSVSDQINPSDVDDSQEESSYASAATGEEGEPVKKEEHEHEGDGSKTKDLREQEPKTEEGKQETETVRREEEQEKNSVEDQVLSSESPAPETEVADQSVKEPTKENVSGPESSSKSEGVASDQQAAAAPEATPQSQPSESNMSAAKETPPEAPDTSTPGSSTSKTPDPTRKTKETKIARLDVANVAVDTERLELKETSTTVCICSLTPDIRINVLESCSVVKVLSGWCNSAGIKPRPNHRCSRGSRKSTRPTRRRQHLGSSLHHVPYPRVPLVPHASAAPHRPTLLY